MPGTVPPSFYLGFLAFVAVVLALDLGVFHRPPHTPSYHEALAWTAVWSMCALGFGGFVAARAGASAAVDWYTAWLIEQSLSIDNIFVFVVVFAALGILPSLGVIVAVRGGAIARSLRCPANARPAAR